MKIYTGFGDQGKTSLFGGQVVDKNNPRVQAYGSLDELSSFLGWLRSKINDTHTIDLLKEVQKELFILSSEVATPGNQYQQKFEDKITPEQVLRIEREIDWYTAQLPPLTKFILPGGTETASLAHVCRTVCRRAERHLVAITQKEAIRSELLIYLNRLSDLLFMIARYANHIDRTEDMEWRGIRRKK